MPTTHPGPRMPRHRRQLVERERLPNPLRPGPHAPPRLVLLAAPPGFGKTTLLTQWLAAEAGRVRVVWRTLDERDAEVAHFLAALVAALAEAAPGAGDDARALLENDRVLPVEDVLAAIVDDLDRLAGPTVVALDDYHRAGSVPVHEALAFLVDNLPPHVTVALTTRADPPVPLGRLRAAGELVEVRAEDLRFTLPEAAAFLHDVMGLDLDPSHVETLERRTEGWVAGLQLAALSAASRGAAGPGDEVGTFLDQFTGSHRFVVDYLVEEVLQAQAEDVRRFLLLTSVLEQLTGPLCDAVTGHDGGQDRLEALERANVFLVAVDEHRRWYRYHHLFADALRSRLGAELPERIPELHRLASRWYAARGLLDEALHHAASGEDAAWLAHLVECALPGLRARRLDRTMIRWLDSLPDATVRVRPVLASVRAWTRLAAGDPAGAAEWLDLAVAALGLADPDAAADASVPEALERGRQEERRLAPAAIAVYRAALAQAAGDADATVRHARAAEAASRPTDHVVRGAASGFLGLAAWAAGDLTTGAATFRSAVRHLEAAGNVTDGFGATVVLALMAVANGDAYEARRLYERALEGVGGHPGAAAAVAGDLHVGLADVLREQADLQGATEHLDLASHLGESAGLPENRFRWHTTRAGLLVARGRFEDALDDLDRADELYRPGYFPDTSPIASRRARVLVAAGRLAGARRWAEEHRVDSADPASYAREHEILTYARLVVAERRSRAAAAGGAGSSGELRDAVGLVDGVVAAASAADRGGSLLEARLVRASASDALGDVGRAQAELAAALGLGAPRGFCRLFLDEGPPLVALLRRLADGRDPTAAGLARQVLGRATASSAGVGARVGGAALSEREREVLALLSSDLSGPEIAAHLFVSINTLRSHTKSIFTKLGVRTRRAAVGRARELGLVRAGR